MSGECFSEFSRGNIPQSNSAVPTLTDECSAIGTERNTGNSLSMPGERFSKLPGGSIPQSDCGVPTPTGER